jgi:opacity protein-like surface antigen
MEPDESTAAPADSTQPTHTTRTHKQTDISVGIFGNFLAARNQNIVSGSGSTLSESSRSQSASPSTGVAVIFHQQLHPLLGYQVTAAYTRSTYSYTYTSANATSAIFSGGSIGTHVAELSAAYVVQGLHSKRVSTFAAIGGGVLAFVPTPTSQNVSYGFRPTETAGLGFNYRLTPHLSLRAEYRGLFFKTPDFRYSGGNLPVTTRYTLTSQPTISLTWNLGKQSINR